MPHIPGVGVSHEWQSQPSVLGDLVGIRISGIFYFSIPDISEVPVLLWVICR